MEGNVTQILLDSQSTSDVSAGTIITKLQDTEKVTLGETFSGVVENLGIFRDVESGEDVAYLENALLLGFDNWVDANKQMLGDHFLDQEFPDDQPDLLSQLYAIAAIVGTKEKTNLILAKIQENPRDCKADALKDATFMQNQGSQILLFAMLDSLVSVLASENSQVQGVFTEMKSCISQVYNKLGRSLVKVVGREHIFDGLVQLAIDVGNQSDGIDSGDEESDSWGEESDSESESEQTPKRLKECEE